MKLNRLLLRALALAVVTPAIVVPIQTEVEASTPTKDFKDVPKSSPNYKIIMDMVDKGIISGYEDGTFKPNEKITRKHAAALMSRALELKEYPNEFHPPNDLPTTHPYFLEMKKMLQIGYMVRNKNGNIYPDRLLTRGEMAQILTKGFILVMGNEHPFTDVNDWNDQYVSALYNAGITTGYEDKTFRETETLTREHFAVFMYRAMKHVEKVDLNALTNKEIYSMDNRQLATYIVAYHDYPNAYYPGGTEAKSNESLAKYRKLGEEFLDRGFIFPEYRSGIEGMSKWGLTKQRTGDIGEIVRDLSENVFGWSAKETIDLFNEAYVNGRYTTSDDIPTAKRKFVMYYNHGGGVMVLRVDKEINGEDK